MELLKTYGELIYGPMQEGKKIEMSVLDIRRLFPDLFSEQDEVCRKFLSQDKVTRNFMFRNRVLDGSTSKTSTAQQMLVYRPDVVPNAPELVWAICKMLERQISVFSGFARCSSINSSSQYVAIGVVDGKIVIRDDIVDDRSYHNVGLVTIERL